MSKQKVVVLGGGTGIYPVTTALKQLPVKISTVIAVTDSGGSSGRIRDEFGFQPVGDLRQSLTSLAEGEGQDWIRKLLLYRFSKGNGLKGHNLGNLILTALQDITGDTSEALYRACQIFRLEGKVIPAALGNSNIKITYADKTTKIGEDYLNPESKIQKQVISISLKPKVQINPHAKKAIEEADYIIIGPGDYYASLQATLLPTGMSSAFNNSKAKLIFIVNLMTRHHQTDQMTASDHVKGIEQLIGQKFDQIILNSQTIPKPVLAAYQKFHEHELVDDLTADPRVIRSSVIGDEIHISNDSDQLHRSYLRHSSQKLKQVFMKLLK